jgi:hypothetical protein
MSTVFIVFLASAVTVALLSLERWLLLIERYFGGLTLLEFIAIVAWAISLVVALLTGSVLAANWILNLLGVVWLA